MLKYIRKRRKDSEKGFTLVELIVVLVILAILAAILVPALLGYIDKARQKQYTEEAHSIYTAIQVLEDEKYAVDADPAANLTDADDLANVNAMVDPTKVISATITLGTESGHAKYTVRGLTLNFTSQNGKTVTIEMDSNGTWGIPTEQ